MCNNNILLTQFEELRNKIKTIDITYPSTGIQHIYVSLLNNKSNCLICNSDKVVIHGYSKRKIIHSYSYNIKTYIIFNQTRFKCKLCNKTFFEYDPFTSIYNGISKLTVLNVLDYLKELNHTFTDAAKQFNLSNTMITRIFDDHVQPKKLKLSKILCIDEVYTRVNSKQLYSTVLLDFNTSTIIDVLSSRLKGYLNDYFEHLGVLELDSVELVIMDMWATYRDVVHRTMPKAKIAVDPFHVLSNITIILNRRRLSVANMYKNNLDVNFTNDYYYLLRDFGFIIQNNYQHITKNLIYIRKYKFNLRKKELLEHLLKVDLKLRNLYHLKEKMIIFYDTTTDINATSNLDEIIIETSNSEYSEVRSYSRMLINWRQEIINSFQKIKGFKYHNGKIERKNRDIKKLLLLSSGYTNQKRLRARIMYSINKDTAITI